MKYRTVYTNLRKRWCEGKGPRGKLCTYGSHVITINGPTCVRLARGHQAYRKPIEVDVLRLLVVSVLQKVFSPFDHWNIINLVIKSTAKSFEAQRLRFQPRESSHLRLLVDILNIWQWSLHKATLKTLLIHIWMPQGYGLMRKQFRWKIFDQMASNCQCVRVWGQRVFKIITYHVILMVDSLYIYIIDLFLRQI